MVLNVKEQEYRVEFGYFSVLKSGVAKLLARLDFNTDAENQLAEIEKLYSALPELLLVGLQKHERAEFGFNYDNESDKECAIEKVCNLIDDYFQDEKNDIMQLLNAVIEELMSNGFFKSLFRQAQKELAAQKNEKDNP